MGSSPRVRGLRLGGKEVSITTGIIPARAGFTTSTPWGVTVVRDHPRACGVYAHFRENARVHSGSSPRVRGLLVRHGVARNNFRIIPARAGFTGKVYLSLVGVWDHPRACGVYRDARLDARHHRGSSPRVRGLRAPARTPAPSTRIIPARAGFTWSREVMGRPHGDHPRACGVYR